MSSVAVHRRVVVTFGMYRATDGSDVEQGEIGTVIGWRGIHEAVVDFSVNERGEHRSACIPIAKLRPVDDR